MTISARRRAWSATRGNGSRQQEKDRRTAVAANNAEQATWVRRLKLLRQSLLNGPSDRSRDAEKQLMDIRDPVAVSPLLQVFGDEVPTLRTLLDRILGGIPGPESAAGLVKHMLMEPDADVRSVTMESLTKRNGPGVISGLTQALRSIDPTVVNRAAWSLGQLNAVTTVPKLIPALVTVQQHLIFPPMQGWPSGTSGTSFGSISPTAGMGGANFGNNINTYGMPTSAGVGPGVAGYGATGIPGPSLPSATYSSGGSGPREQMPKPLTLRFQNLEVLSSLVKLTGQDFGFNIPAWQQWVASGYRPDPTPVRRVPQP